LRLIEECLVPRSTGDGENRARPSDHLGRFRDAAGGGEGACVPNECQPAVALIGIKPVPEGYRLRRGRCGLCRVPERKLCTGDAERGVSQIGRSVSLRAQQNGSSR
jgi:hypothetical protein